MKELKQISLHNKYAPLFEDKTSRYFLITGGRGSGKSSVLSIFSTWLLTQERHEKVLYTRQTLTSADKSIIPEYTGWANTMGYGGSFESTKTNIRFHNGNEIIFSGIQAASGDQTARLKSIPKVTNFILDEALELTNERTFDDINYSFREKNAKTRIILVLNPDHIQHWIYKKWFEGKGPDGKDLPQEFNGKIGNVRYIHTTYEDNIENLDEDFLNEAKQLEKNNFKKFLHHFRGHWQVESDNVLFKYRWIQENRVSEDMVPSLKRIVVAVDPAVTANKASDHTGIVVAGQGSDNHFYVLGDYSMKASPHEWATEVEKVYNLWEADKIIAERNQGGDLVESNLRTINQHLPIKTVHAKRGKILRAEPIAALYEQQMVHHVGSFRHLELEQTTYDGTGKSPDRLDALVYALTELSGGQIIAHSGLNFETEDKEAKKKEPGLVVIDQKHPSVERSIFELMESEELWTDI